jgi:hypothetical protein
MDRLGIAKGLCEYERNSRNLKTLKNSYLILYEGRSYRIDPGAASPLGWGFDYYLEVLRLIEQRHDITGITFLLSNDCPPKLPSYGPTTVLLVLCDEWYKYFPYFYDLRCVFKCYTLKPSFVFPAVGFAGQIAATFQTLKKSAEGLHSRLHAKFEARTTFQASARIYPLPLGYFAKPSNLDLLAQRDIGFFFAGSVEYPTVDSYLRRILSPPKLASRRLMANSAREYLDAHPESGVLRLTNGFLGSVANADNYWPLLIRSRIALCPRGGVAETYRFFEAAAAGCVIISEALPRAWYYDGHPAIIIRNWKQLGDVLEGLLQDEDKMLELADRSTQYWNNRVSESAVAEYIARRLTPPV